MRAPLATAALALTLLACGDSNDPSKLFPEANEVFNVSGVFDGLSSNDAHFEGTLTLNQADRSTGSLTGSAAYLVTINGDIFNVTDDNLTGANISTNGNVTYTMVQGGASWTFTGTLQNKAILGGRHTLSSSSGSNSGSWNATNAAASVVAARKAHPNSVPTISLDELERRLTH